MFRGGPRRAGVLPWEEQSYAWRSPVHVLPEYKSVLDILTVSTAVSTQELLAGGHRAQSESTAGCLTRSSSTSPGDMSRGVLTYHGARAAR